MDEFDTDVDPLWTVMKEGGPHHAKGFLPQYIAWLRKTGREYGIDELIRRHPGEFSDRWKAIAPQAGHRRRREKRIR